MKIAIHQNHNIFDHSTLWTKPWIEYCKNQNNVEYELVNCFDVNILEHLKSFDILLWHFTHYSIQDMQFARIILSAAQNMGIKIFPDYKTSWHFDDKIAETYLLKTINATIPKSWIYYTKSTANSYFQNECRYPVVAKLKCGSGSTNVKLLKNVDDSLKYTKKMFGNGYKSTPNVLLKVKSNIKSSKTWSTVVSRFKRIPDFLNVLKNASKFPNEKGYVFLQEYIPNDGYDLKVIVVGGKLSFLIRDVRKGDFRASGGGIIRYDKSLITPKIRKAVFNISDKLGFQCMGYDFVVDNRNGIGKIVEISYGFSHTAQMGLGGYWDRDDNWHNIPLNVPEEIIKNIIRD